MKKILAFIIAIAMGIGVADAAVRDGNAPSRAGGAATATTQRRIATTEKSSRTTTPRTTVLGTSRGAGKSVSARTTKTTTRNTTARTTTPAKTVTARATDDTMSTTETRTGAAYETCKTAYFTCMDQFCSLKNDDYRRCSCSNRVDSLAQSRAVLANAGEQLTVFTESLDVVGMTAAQATAMHTASDGENALTSDTSASKALLQAIMNSIRGGDTTVGGKYSNLNSIDLSFDTAASFGTDNSQIVASYNGQNLYSAVYPQCRNAVRADCTDSALQRAVTAYLMAIEQDCNTVQTAIEQKQREMKSAIREGSAMLDLARIENRQKHNTDDLTTCINNVESAILSEQVCGANYHKCLDNGEFIDISTGAPIVGVVKFYELGNLLKFNTGVDAAMQKLSKISRNKTFVNNFEKRTKKFAKPALDKCTEIADTVWEEYLDKAMLAIYYAQQSKVDEIKQGCFDFVSKCYESSDASITAAMAQLLGTSTVILQPDKVALSSQMCTDYVESCDNMFKRDDEDKGIIAQYVEMRESADTLAACRAVVKQCFDKYGGTSYENFYYPYSGLFETGQAPDWFALYDTDGKTLKSPCAQQLAGVSACSDPEMLERAFGGFDVIMATKATYDNNPVFVVDDSSNDDTNTIYGIRQDSTSTVKIGGSDVPNATIIRHRELRSVGVATEIYNQIIDTLSTRCMNINGRFMEIQFLQNGVYNDDVFNKDNGNYCQWHTINNTTETDAYRNLNSAYAIISNENMCPRDYNLSVDVKSWGACSCWGNGGRRSKNGKTATCVPVLPGATDTWTADAACSTPDVTFSDANVANPQKWCTNVHDSMNRVCPSGFYELTDGDTQACKKNSSDEFPGSFFNDLVPEGI